MATKKLSQITAAGSPPALTDQVVGVTGGTTDNLYTLADIQSGLGTRTVLTENTDFYVATTGSDSNNGSSGSPWLTLTHAMEYISANLDIAGFYVRVHIGAGSFQGFGVRSTVGGGAVQFDGAGSGSTTITAGPNDGTYNNGDCFAYNALTTSTFGINKVTFSLSNSAVNLVGCLAGMQGFTLGDGITYSNTDLAFTGTCAQAIFISGVSTIGIAPGTITVNNLTCSGGTASVMSANAGSVITDSATWTLTGTNSFTRFIWVQSSIYNSVGSTFAVSSGSTTGKRFDDVIGSTIYTDFSGLSFFPGSTAGVVDDTSNYDNSVFISTITPTTGTLDVAGALSVSISASIFVNSNSIYDPVVLRNSNAGSSAQTRVTVESDQFASGGLHMFLCSSGLGGGYSNAGGFWNDVGPLVFSANNTPELDFGITNSGNWTLSSPIIAATYVVASLPSGKTGAMARVSDGDSGLAWGATVTNSGSGATPYLVWYNGSHWTVTGK